MSLSWQSVKIVIMAAALLYPLSLPAFAETKLILAEGFYVMGDGDTPIIAEARALEQAKKLALEQAGTYVRSYSKSKNFDLTGDEVEMLSAGIMETEVQEKKRTMAGGSFSFSVRIFNSL